MLKKETLKYIVKYINGDGYEKPIYMSGPNLIDFFSKYGFEDEYGKGFPSRADYTHGNLIELNKDRNKILKIIREILDKRRFIGNNEVFDLFFREMNIVLAAEGIVLTEEITGVSLSFNDSINNGSVTSITSGIEDIILEELEKCQYLVWIAVAWITNPKIISKLKELKQKGVDVSIIVTNSSDNDLIERELNAIKMSSFSKYENTMHHKFAIFDLKKAISGSYNWTKKLTTIMKTFKS